MCNSRTATEVYNQRILLKRLGAYRREVDNRRALVDLSRAVRALRRGKFTLDETRGWEGRAAACYWPSLKLLAREDWIFKGLRRRRQGFDPFNVAVDALSWMLCRETAQALDRAGLDPARGLLHETRDGAAALAYDLAEEFRAPVVEAAAMAFFARNEMRQEHFMPADEGGVRFTREGYRALIRAYEAWLARAIADPQTGDKLLWRGLMLRQAQRLAAAMEGAAPYLAYKMDY